MTATGDDPYARGRFVRHLQLRLERLDGADAGKMRVSSPQARGWAATVRPHPDALWEAIREAFTEATVAGYARWQGARYDHDELTETDDPTEPPPLRGRPDPDLMTQRVQTRTVVSWSRHSITRPDLVDPADWTPLPDGRWRSPTGRCFRPDASQVLRMLRKRRARALGSWENSAFTPEGELKAAYRSRLDRVLDACDDAGIVVIVGYFYIAQTRLLADEAAVVRATEEATHWLLGSGHENLMVEIANEIDIPLFHHDILSPVRVPELMELVRRIDQKSRRLPVSTSLTWLPFFAEAGVELPDLRSNGFELRASMAKADPGPVLTGSDYILFHTNTLGAADQTLVIEAVRRRPELAEHVRPVCINEDGTPVANLDTAARHGIGWGYYDQGQRNNYTEGFQSPPVNWTLSTREKLDFFSRVKEITGA